MLRPTALFVAPVRELVAHRQLLFTLTARDLRVRYRQSAMGLGWAVLNPLLLMLVFTFVFAGALRPAFLRGLNVPYPLYALAGLVPWNFFSGAVMQCANSLVANRNLVTKVALPREVFPFTCVATALIDLGIALVVLEGVAVWFSLRGTAAVGLHAAALWLVPIIVILVCMAAGVGLLVALANLFYRDVRQVLTVLLQLIMFVSAVVVPLPEGRWGAVLAWNPVALAVGAFRECLLAGRGPDWAMLAYCAAWAVVLLSVAWTVFRRSARRFAEVI